MDGLTLTILFLFISMPIIRYNTISLFTIFYCTTVIYFISVFIGYYIHASFLPHTIIMDLRETTDLAKYIFLFIIFHISIFHWLSIKLSLVKPINITHSPKLDKIKNISAILMVVMIIASTIKLGNVIFSEQKHDIMDNLGTFYNAKVIFQLFLFSALLLIKGDNKVYWVLIIIGIIFDLFIGFRYTLVFSAIIYFIIRFYGYKISGRKILYGSMVFALFFVFFASFGNIRTELRLFDFQGILVKMSSITWWAYNFTHFEPMHIFAIFNETLNASFSCSPVDILGTSFVVSFIPFSSFFIELNTFHDCFVPKIFSGFENISSNPWAEFYSFFGMLGVVFLIWFLGSFLMVSQVLLKKKSLFTLIFMITLLGIFFGYFQRSDFVILFFSIKRIFMGIIPVFLLTLVKFQWRKK